MPRKKMIAKCGFKTHKDNTNLHSIAFNYLTSGEVLALIHALQIARTISPVAQDLSNYLRNVLQVITSGDQAVIEKAQEFFEEISNESDVQIVTKESEIENDSPSLLQCFQPR